MLKMAVRGLACPAAASLMVLAFTACGSSDDTAGTTAKTSTAAADSPAVATAKAEFAKYAKPQPAITLPQLPEKPPSGKTITIATCPLPVCKAETDPAKEYAEKLGWKVTYVQTDLTPASYQSTLDQILQNPTDMAAIGPVVPNSVVSKQLDALQKKGIDIVEFAPAGDRGTAEGPVLATVTGPESLAQSGRLMGSAIVADKGSAPKTLFVWDPALAPTFGSIKDAFTKEVQSAGGTVGVLNTNIGDVGKSVPTQVVSYLQSHPDVEYVAFVVADFGTGVPQALKSAGLSDQVKIISRAPQAANLENVKTGAEWAMVGEENASAGVRAIDQLARITMDQPLSDELRNPAGWAEIYTKDNPPRGDTVTTPGYPEAFLKAWNIG